MIRTETTVEFINGNIIVIEHYNPEEKVRSYSVSFQQSGTEKIDGIVSLTAKEMAMLYAAIKRMVQGMAVEQIDSMVAKNLVKVVNGD